MDYQCINVNCIIYRHTLFSFHFKQNDYIEIYKKENLCKFQIYINFLFLDPSQLVSLIKFSRTALALPDSIASLVIFIHSFKSLLIPAM